MEPMFSSSRPVTRLVYILTHYREVPMFVRFLPGVVAIALILGASSPVLAQATAAGHWEGSFNAEGREIGLGLDLAQNAKAEWVASMSMPAANATGLVVTDVVVTGRSVKFTGVELMMAKFDLTLGVDGKLKGTLSNAQSSVPIEFRRTGEAKVELIAASPAVSREFEGDWEGAIETGGAPFRLVFHFHNLPNGTVAATIDSPNMGAVGVPLNDVKQTGRGLEFGIKVAHGRFQGTLNREGTEIIGQFSHEQNSAPMTLRKK
jgi:hypothetical protein